MKRSEQRETIFKLLFMKPFSSEAEMEERIGLYLENLKEGLEEAPYGTSMSEQDSDYIRSKLARIEEKLPEIDQMLNESSKGWKTSRMSKVDLSILRLAIYEIAFDEDIPTGVAINEAVEIAKHYGGDASASFINGVLGQAARRLEPARTETESMGD